MFFQTVLQGAAADAQGLGRTLAVPMAFAQSLLQRLACGEFQWTVQNMETGLKQRSFFVLEVLWQITQIQDVPSAENQGSLQHVFQLPHVPGPFMAAEGIKEFSGYRSDGFTVFTTQLGKEKIAGGSIPKL